MIVADFIKKEKYTSKEIESLGVEIGVYSVDKYGYAIKTVEAEDMELCFIVDARDGEQDRVWRLIYKR